MAWPPKIGELLPGAAEAIGVRKKLVDYSLDLTNEVGGPKAQGFKLILGITITDVTYLENAILSGILITPISEVRDNYPYGINCVAQIPVRGIGLKSERVIDVRTVWEITGHGAQPRLVSAFPRP